MKKSRTRLRCVYIHGGGFLILFYNLSLTTSRTIKSRVVVLYKMMNPYYAGGLGIPYMMGMSGPGYSLGASIYGIGMGTGTLYPYGMATTNPYAYTGMYGIGF
ncbi:hypothetical protein I312_105679 [Cryptococcus bacillisporus CA1280]|uniref:uncharacterized protein n=1 Tax=Cryptococcus bacillisporus CA1280 TaxID=1296109 RepID=UPI0033690DA2